jgi:anti-sigma factor RsiW
MTHLTEEQLNDLADAVLADDERAAAEAHLTACAACRFELDSLRLVLADVHALPAAVAPARDLLPDIHAAIDREQHTVLPARWRQHTLWAARWPLAAAAVLLIVSTAVMTRVLTDRSAPPAQAAATSGQAQFVSVEATLLEQKYKSAIDELQNLIEVQRANLSPSTLKLLEENMRVIDAAIRESRAALQQRPDNELINESLWSAYEKKLEMLRRATDVSAT